MERMEVLPECKEMFKALDNKLDQLIERSDRIDHRYERHIEESVKYRREVDKHELLLNLIEKEKLNTMKASQWRVGLIVGGVVGVITTLARILWK
jgi:hypothetical protein